MSEILKQPKSVGLLQPTKFQLEFNRIPNVKYFCQKIPIPGFSMPIAKQTTPFLDRKIPGNKISYDPLEITFIIEETLESWMEIWRWCKGLGKQDSYDDYANLNRQSRMVIDTPTPQYSDAILTVLSSQNNPSVRVKFQDCFPISLTKIDFDASKSAEETMTATAIIEFFQYDIEIIRTS